MKGTIERYVDRVLAIADIRDAGRAAAIRAELMDHLQEKVVELEGAGMARDEALVKAVEEQGSAIRIGYSLREWRLVDVRLQGTARGFIAIGHRAYGVVAIGGLAVGVFAFGGLAIGAISFGGLALAVLFSWGGIAAGLFSYGGMALGLVSFGGMALGGVAIGGSAAGLWVPSARLCFGSYFTPETVPAWMGTLGDALTYDFRSPAEAAAFGNLLSTLSAVTVTFLMFGLLLQFVLLHKEQKRVQAIAGPTMQ
jgi:hypothetical protein